MSKITAIRTNKLFTMYREVNKRKGRGSQFQWNAKSQYTIMHKTKPYIGMPSKVFNTFEEADKEWVYLLLRYL